ncbi:hypothetical protein CEE69_02120 [Rhodopirellula bahusiensis]|uniref:Uncharacterized protein n=1 Tax=Rhodopirellula bahusiensis TaxID=2014065 RepID=A0A2G1WEG5_9BACT|nr:hypothetical protein CEE69_02120 [Rhodopirellula bahusiensis]
MSRNTPFAVVFGNMPTVEFAPRAPGRSIYAAVAPATPRLTFGARKKAPMVIAVAERDDGGALKLLPAIWYSPSRTE